jgi:uncharacterized protein YbcV (DUF1398 family)
MNEEIIESADINNSLYTVTSTKAQNRATIKLKNMNRLKEQTEIWKLGATESLSVKYSFKKELKKNDLGFIRQKHDSDLLSDISDDLFDSKKYKENSIKYSSLKEKERGNFLINKFELELDSEEEPDLSFHERVKLNYSTQQDNLQHPKKTNSLFSKAQETSNDNINSNFLKPLAEVVPRKNTAINDELGRNPSNFSNLENKLVISSPNPFLQEKNKLIPQKINSCALTPECEGSNTVHNNSSGNLSATATPVNVAVHLDYEEIDLEHIEKENKQALYKDSYCEAFFIAGLPTKNAKIILDSDEYLSPCKHKICSILPAYKPDIINKFQMGDSIYPVSKTNLISKFEITQATSNLCFPQGIKICYHDREEEILPMNNFTTVTTNESGKRHYIFVYHYYQKISLPGFKSKYEFDPVTDHNRYNKNVKYLIEKLTEEDIEGRKDQTKLEQLYQDNHEMCCELISRDYIYLPKCACLVSKLPYSSQMEKSIAMLLKMSVDELITDEDMNRLLLNLIYEIPIPPINKKLNFYLPYCISALELPGKLQRDLPIINNCIKMLLNFFTPEMIVSIHHLTLLENKILFVYDDYTNLSQVSQAFISLLYPMQWINTYIPVLSEEMMKYIKSFMPFIMGVDSTLFNCFIKNDEFDEDSKVYIIMIKPERKSRIESSATFVPGKKNSLKLKEIERYLPEMPYETSKDLVLELQEFFKIYEKQNKNEFYNNTQNNECTSHYYNDAKLEKKFRLLFIKSNVLLFGDYKKYVSFIDDSNYFNSQSYVSSRPEKFQQFYNELTSSGIFRHFLNNKSDSFPYFDKMSTRYVNNILSRMNVKRFGSASRKSLLYSDSKISNSKKERSNSIFRKDSVIRNSKANNTSTIQFNESISPNRRSKLVVPTPENRKNSIVNLMSMNSVNKTPVPKKISNSNINTHMNLFDRVGFSISHENDSINVGNESKDNIEIYSVAPCFLSNTIKSVIPYEEMIAEKFKYALESSTASTKNSSVGNHNLNKISESRIFPVNLQKDFKIDKMPRKFKNYVIPGYEKYLISTSQLKDHNRASKTTNKSSDNTDDENEKKLIEQTKEIINDYLKMIITAEHYTQIDNSTIINAVKTKYGRSHFSNILFQNKFKESKTQILCEKSFEDLYHIIYNSMVFFPNDPSQFEDVMKVTKSTFYYYK